MNQPLLTIIVPTYNRAERLAVLLAALNIELTGALGRVSVIIGDNASTDDTPLQIQSFVHTWPETRVLRHERNVGPDENFCRCLEQVHTDYFWIIGDDDLPRAGVVAALLPLLDESCPDLVYLNSHWSPTLLSRDANGSLAAPLHAMSMDGLTFARCVHIWTTFISGCIVKRAHAPNETLRRYSGTNLVQLGWVLRALRDGDRFVYIKESCVFATAGNSGGYNLLKVFGNNFQRIVKESFAKIHKHVCLGESMILRGNIHYLPGLIRGWKNGRAGKFDSDEDMGKAFNKDLVETIYYKYILKNISSEKRIISILSYTVARATSKMLSLCDYIRAFHLRKCTITQKMSHNNHASD